VHEDLNMHMDSNAKLVNINLSTPSIIAEENLNNYSIIKKINYYHINCEGIKCIYKIFYFIQKLK